MLSMFLDECYLFPIVHFLNMGPPGVSVQNVG